MCVHNIVNKVKLHLFYIFTFVFYYYTVYKLCRQNQKKTLSQVVTISSNYIMFALAIRLAFSSALIGLLILIFFP